MAERIRKIDRMHRLFGEIPEHRCGECCNFVSGKYHDRTLQKCRAYGMTHSEASDWAKKWTACGLFNREYTGIPVMKLARGDGHETRPPEAPLDGQMEMDLGQAICTSGAPDS